MSPYAILGLSLLAVLVTVILAFAFAPRPRKVGMHPALFAGYGRDDSLDDVHHRTLGGGRPPARASAKPKIFLTPRQLERVNIQRKLRNKPPLNQVGFANAAAHAWDQPRRQPDNSSEWLMYFVMYECLIADHQSHLVSASGSLTIDPKQPAQTMPPLFVNAHGVVIDGTHRLAAAMRRGDKTILAYTPVLKHDGKTAGKRSEATTSMTVGTTDPNFPMPVLIRWEQGMRWREPVTIHPRGAQFRPKG